MAEQVQPEYGEFGVNASAHITCPPGTAVRQDRECAVLLPNGATLKFWVSAEIQWGDDDPVEISYNDMTAMGVYLEPDGGAVVPE